MAVDACLVALAYYLAYVLRFDSGIPERYEDLLGGTVGFVVLLKLALFAAFGLYSKLWRFVDQADFESIVKAVVVSSFVLIGGLFLLPAGVVRPAARRDRARLPAHAGAGRRRALPRARPGRAPAAPAARRSAPTPRC